MTDETTNNPTTPETVVPTTDTPVADVSTPGNGEASAPDSDASGLSSTELASSTPVVPDAPLVPFPPSDTAPDVLLYNAGTKVIFTGPVSKTAEEGITQIAVADVQTLKLEGATVDISALGADSLANVHATAVPPAAAPVLATEADVAGIPRIDPDAPTPALHQQIAPHLEAIYVTVKASVEQQGEAQVSIFAKVRAAIESIEEKIKNGVEVGSHELVTELAKLKALL